MIWICSNKTINNQEVKSPNKSNTKNKIIQDEENKIIDTTNLRTRSQKKNQENSKEKIPIKISQPIKKKILRESNKNSYNISTPIKTKPEVPNKTSNNSTPSFVGLKAEEKIKPKKIHKLTFENVQDSIYLSKTRSRSNSISRSSPNTKVFS